MALIKSDNFSSANDGWELNFIGWTKHPNYSRLYVAGGSKQVVDYNALSCHYWPTAPASADQRNAADLIIGDYGTEAGKVGWVAVRLQIDANTMYRAGKIDGFWRIEKVVNGVVTVIGTSVQQYVHNVTQRVTLEAIDNGSGGVDLKLYRNAETTPIVSGTDSTSPITAIGYIGIGLNANALIKIDNVQADTIEAAGGATAIAATLGNIAGSVASNVSPISTISATMANVAGSFASGSGSLTTTITATLANVVGSITSSGSLSNGTFTSEVLKDYAGNVLANVSLNFVRFYNDTTGALVLSKSGVSTNGSGIVSFSDPALVAGTTYRVDWETSSGSRRMPRKAAA